MRAVESESISRRAAIPHLILLISLSVIVWVPRWQGPIDLRSDPGVYYILGTSLAQGKGYRLLNEPGEIQAIQYPPLLPTLVALHQQVLGTSDHRVVGSWLKLTYAALSMVYALATYGLARQYVTPGLSLLVALISAFDVNVICYSEMLYAEMPFAVITVLFVLSDKMCQGRLVSIPTSLLGICAYLIRSAGLALLAAWVAEALLKRRWKQAAVRTGILVLPIMAWQSYIHHVKASKEYEHPAYAYQRAPYQFNNVGYIDNILLTDPFAPEQGRLTPVGLGARIASNLLIAPEQLGGAILGGEQLRQGLLTLERRLGAPRLLLSRAVGFILVSEGLLVLGGVVLLWYRGEWVIPLYVIASLGLIGIIPWSQGFRRYLTPLQPFLFLSVVGLLASFAGFTLHHWSRGWRFVGPVVLGLLVTLILIKEAVNDVRSLLVVRNPVYQGGETGQGSAYKLMRYDRASYRLDEALAWLKGHAGTGEVVAVQEPHWAYLKTGLKAVLPPMETDPAKAQVFLDSVPVDYLVLDETKILDVIPRYAKPVIHAFPACWELVFTSPGSQTQIYRRLRADRAAPAVRKP
jgi:hypothetical protein